MYERNQKRGNEVGWEEAHGDRVPLLAWSSSEPCHIHAEGPDSVPPEHSSVRNKLDPRALTLS